MKRRIIEFLKDILIVILVIAILALTILALPTQTIASSPFLSKLVTPFAGVLGIDQAELVYTETAVPALDAAQPLVISIRNSAGRYSCQYDFAALDGLYESLGGTLAQALETASQPSDTTQAKLYAAARGVSALLCYPAQLPCEVLGAWLGVEVLQNGEQSDIFVLSAQEGPTLRLYLYGETCRVLETQVPAEPFVQLLDSYRPDGGLFAFEDESGLYAHVGPFSIISADTPKIIRAASVNPCESRFVTALVTELGFNPYGDAGYTDSAGNAFFSETACWLRISADGTLEYESNGDNRFSAASISAQDRIEAARGLLEQIGGDVIGSARLYLTSYRLTEQGATCEFDYVLEGVPVAQHGKGAAATVTFTGRTITALNLRIRTYTLGAETYSLIPPAQAAAIVPEGTTLRIFYDDVGGEMAAGWKAE